MMCYENERGEVIVLSSFLMVSFSAFKGGFFLGVYVCMCVCIWAGLQEKKKKKR